MHIIYTLAGLGPRNFICLFFRGHEVICRVQERVLRSNKIIFCGHKIVLLSHEIVFRSWLSAIKNNCNLVRLGSKLKGI